MIAISYWKAGARKRTVPSAEEITFSVAVYTALYVLKKETRKGWLGKKPDTVTETEERGREGMPCQFSHLCTY